MDRRGGILVALIAVSAFLAGLLAGSHGARIASKSVPEPTGDAASSALATAPANPARLDAAPTDLRATTSEARLADAIERTLEGGSPAPAENQVALDGLRPALIRVRVVDGDGKAVPAAAVYGIPKGTPFRGNGRTPRATTDALGRATLTVPAAGPYVVTVQANLRVAVREDVQATAEGRGEVAIDVGRLANVEVRRTGVADALPWRAWVWIPAPTLADGTVVGDYFQPSLSSTEDSIVLSLPEGVPFQVRAERDREDRGWARWIPAGHEYAEVSAPAEFVVEYRERTAADDRPTTVQVTVEVAVLPETGALPATGRVAYAFRERYAGSPSWEDEGRIEWGRGDAAPSVSYSAGAWPPQTPGRIEWTVAGVSGSVDVPAARAGDEIQLAGSVRIPASAVETGVRDVEVLDERGAPVPVGGDRETSATLFTTDDYLGHSSADLAESELHTWLIDRVGQKITASKGAWRVSSPGSATTDGTVRLQLELGGFLLVHMRTPLREGLGRLTVERTDGGWLGACTQPGALPHPAEDVDVGATSGDSVGSGTLLGPLPPGDVELRFRLGGVEVGRTTAHVVGGEVSVLTIR